MTHTPIYDEVRRALSRSDRGWSRRRGADGDDAPRTTSERPVMLRGYGGRHRRDLD